MRLSDEMGFFSELVSHLFTDIIQHGLVCFHTFPVCIRHNKTGTPQNDTAMYRHFSNSDLSYFKMLFELNDRSAVQASVNISICIERDMDIGVTEPVFQNDRLHSSLDASCSKCMTK